MSKHWNPRVGAGGRGPRQGWPGQWDRRRWASAKNGAGRSDGRAGLVEIAFMIAAGAFLGTVYAIATAKPVAWPFGFGTETANPYYVRVIDGDTIDNHGTRVRIADIDAPEVHGRCPYETDLAARATSRMRALIDAGPFELHRTGTRDLDIYGRELRIVTRDGRSLGDQLVAEGLARTWTGHREPWC